MFPRFSEVTVAVGQDLLLQLGWWQWYFCSRAECKRCKVISKEVLGLWWVKLSQSRESLRAEPRMAEMSEACIV